MAKQDKIIEGILAKEKENSKIHIDKVREYLRIAINQQEEKSIKAYTRFILEKYCKTGDFDDSDIDDLMFSFGFNYEKGDEEDE